MAVFLAGPYRFAPLVQASLHRVLGAIDFDVFFHIWKEDLGSKKRVELDKDYNKLIKHKKTKLFLLASPYCEQDYLDSVGVHTNSNSSINATMGMFMSMNVLSNYLELLPDSSSYTHVLRIRTDCLIFESLEATIKENQNSVLVSNNFFVPQSWVSDHIMIAPKDLFYCFWRFKSMDHVYQAYRRGHRNPEKTMKHLGKPIRKKVIKKFNRGVDYHIVYYPSSQNDPPFVKKILLEHGVEYLFDNIDGLKDSIKISNERYRELVDFQKKLKDPYTVRNKFIGKLNTIVRRRN